MLGLILALLSGLSMALLAALAAVQWQRARAAGLRAIESERREAWLEEATQRFFSASRRSSDAVLDALHRCVIEREPAVDAMLVFDVCADELHCIRAYGRRAEHWSQLRLRRDDRQLAIARAAGAGHRVLAPAEAAAIVPTDRRALAVPLRDGDSVRGAVYVASSDPTALDDVDTLVRAIERSAAPHAMARDRESDRADATFDGLTGAYTPRAFRRRLHEDLARASPGAAITLWFIDTDSFKRVNDEFGHRAGDRVLQAMVRLLESHLVPGIDLAARNGGDEFCAIVRCVPKSVAIERAQRYCDAVRTFDFELPIPITASIGVASFPHDAGSSSELLEAADAAMYHSKRTGRDRVSFIVAPSTYAVVTV
jgi:diguanylate cyclase (GGDEF)-like protein